MRNVRNDRAASVCQQPHDGLILGQVIMKRPNLTCLLVHAVGRAFNLATLVSQCVQTRFHHTIPRFEMCRKTCNGITLFVVLIIQPRHDCCLMVRICIALASLME